MISTLNAAQTVENFRPLDYWLNRRADSSGCYRGYQLLSYLTHPVDLLIQAALFPALHAFKPFYTAWVNYRSNHTGKACINAVFIPVKLAYAVPKVFGYELGKVVQMGWSLLGLNMVVNVAKGKRQTHAFFLKRIFATHLNNLLVNQFETYDLPFTPKKVQNVCALFLPKDYKGMVDLKKLEEGGYLEKDERLCFRNNMLKCCPVSFGAIYLLQKAPAMLFIQSSGLLLGKLRTCWKGY